MRPLLDLALVAAVLGAAVWAAVLFARSKDRAASSRVDRARAAAAARGWDFAEADDALASALTQPPFTDGHLPEARNVVTGRLRGRALLLFDHVCMTPAPGEAVALGAQVHRVAALHVDVATSGIRLRSGYAAILARHRGTGVALDGQWLLVHQRVGGLTHPERGHWIDDLAQAERILEDLVELPT